VILGVLLDYSFEGVNLFGRLLLTAITVTVIATIYEVTIHFINEDNKVNWWDVIITVIPALITVLILWI
jgi:accessory gene regulator protein AgrB